MTGKQGGKQLASDLYISGLGLAHFVRGAERLGIDVEPILEARGIDRETHFDPQYQVPGALYEDLLLEMILLSKDPLFGFHLGQQMVPGAYGVLGHLALGSATVADMLRLLTTFQSLAGNMGEASLEPGDHGEVWVVWRMTHSNPVIRQHVTDNMLTLAIQFMRAGSGQQNLKPERILAEHKMSAEQRQAMSDFAGLEVEDQAGRNALLLSEKLLNTALSPFDNLTRQTLEQEAERQLKMLSGHTDWLASVRHHLQMTLQESPPRRQQVAEKLGVSVRTLDRRLADAGISWQQLLDSTRAQLARDYLADPKMTVAEVSKRLGFTDVRAFQRRFRQWAGMTPSEFRQRRQ